MAGREPFSCVERQILARAARRRIGLWVVLGVEAVALVTVLVLAYGARGRPMGVWLGAVGAVLAAAVLGMLWNMRCPACGGVGLTFRNPRCHKCGARLR
jgi:hypothetical protein